MRFHITSKQKDLETVLEYLFNSSKLNSKCSFTYNILLIIWLLNLNIRVVGFEPTWLKALVS